MNPREYALVEIKRMQDMFDDVNFLQSKYFDNLSLQFLLERAFEQGQKTGLVE